MLRVGEQIKQIIAETLTRGHFHHEALMAAGNLIVSEVRVSPDLRNARAYVSSLGGDDVEDILPVLNSSSAIFQKDVSKNSNLKFTPKIRFVRDESFEEAQRIDELLRSVHIPDDEPEDAPEDGQDT